MKKIILLFLIFGYPNSLIYPIVVLPPQQNYNTRTAEALGNLIGTSIGLITRAIVTRKAQKDQNRNIQKSYIEAAFNNTKQQSLKELIESPFIEPPLQEPKKNYFIATIIFLLFALILLVVFLKKRNNWIAMWKHIFKH